MFNDGTTVPMCRATIARCIALATKGLDPAVTARALLLEAHVERIENSTSVVRLIKSDLPSASI
jgi:hypothetical protein